jgi:membrane protein implicated in regulation of membrane protease activity
MVRGEAWQVHADQPLAVGQPVRVRAVRGLTLEVEPAVEPASQVDDSSGEAS